MNTSGNGTATVTISTPSSVTTHSTTNLNLPNNTTIINASQQQQQQQQQTQHLHIQATPIQANSINTGSLVNNNNNSVTINANNGTKKKRYSLNIVNVKTTSGNESTEDVESDNAAITFTSNVSTPAVKEESSVAPWTVTETIQDIQTEYVVDQSRE